MIQMGLIPCPVMTIKHTFWTAVLKCGILWHMKCLYMFVKQLFVQKHFLWTIVTKERISLMLSLTGCIQKTLLWVSMGTQMTCIVLALEARFFMLLQVIHTIKIFFTFATYNLFCWWCITINTICGIDTLTCVLSSNDYYILHCTINIRSQTYCIYSFCNFYTTEGNSDILTSSDSSVSVRKNPLLFCCPLNQLLIVVTSASQQLSFSQCPYISLTSLKGCWW